MKLALSEI